MILTVSPDDRQGFIVKLFIRFRRFGDLCYVGSVFKGYLKDGIQRVGFT